MNVQLAVDPSLVARVRDRLDRARSGLEHTASSVPTAIDAGEVTTLLTSMLARVIDGSATVSDSLGAVSSQVGRADRAFWLVDDQVAHVCTGPVSRGH